MARTPEELERLREEVRIADARIRKEREEEKEAARLAKNAAQAEARVRLKAGHAPVTDVEKHEHQKHLNISAATKRSQAALSPEKKAKIREARRKANTDMWAAKDEAKYQQDIARWHAGRDRAWQALSPEEKAARHKLHVLGSLALWDSFSAEEKQHKAQKLTQANVKAWHLLTAEEKLARHVPTREGLRRWWSDLGDEERDRVVRAMVDRLSAARALIPPEKRKEYSVLANLASQKEWQSLSPEVRSKRAHEAAKASWAAMPEDTRTIRGQQGAARLQAFWKTVTSDQYTEIFSTEKGPNKPERKLQAMMPACVRYTGNKAFHIQFPGKKKNPDFIVEPFRQYRAVVEHYGDWWHRNDSAEEMVALYFERGIRCLVIWEKELKDPATLQHRIDAFFQEVLHGRDQEDSRAEGSPETDRDCQAGSGDAGAEGGADPQTGGHHGGQP